jgi:hypothetical protein
MPEDAPIAAPARALELEYNSLRAEILKRIELRQQIVSMMLTLAGIFLGVGLSQDMVALIYPPLAAFLCSAWAQNDFRVRELARYIRQNLEPSMPGMGYERAVFERRFGVKGDPRRSHVVPHSGIFLFTQLMAIGIDLFRVWPPEMNPARVILLAVAVASVVIVWWLARDGNRQS